MDPLSVMLELVRGRSRAAQKWSQMDPLRLQRQTAGEKSAAGVKANSFSPQCRKKGQSTFYIWTSIFQDYKRILLPPHSPSYISTMALHNMEYS